MLCRVKEDYLEGLAFIDEALATGKTIRYLNVEDLPEDPVKRWIFELNSYFLSKRVH